MSSQSTDSRDQPGDLVPELPRYKGDQRKAPAAATLADWSSMARGAFAANTLRAWKADWEIFTEFCGSHRLTSMPTAAQTVRDFVLACLGNQKKPATIRRYVSTIGRAHRGAGVADPTATDAVKLALKEMGRSVPSRQTQARGLVWSEIAQFLEFDVRNLRDIRDRALVSVAYDTMCRREELVNLRIQDVAKSGDGSGSVLIRRSKTDTAGEGATAYMSPLTMRLVGEWLEASRRKETAPGKGQRAQVREASQSRASDSPSPGEGRKPEQPGASEKRTLFARVAGSTAADVLTAQSVSAIFRKVGKWIGLPAEEVRRISGHSCRVGAAQDLLALNMDLPSVMQAGRWRDTRMPMRYGDSLSYISTRDVANSLRRVRNARGARRARGARGARHRFSSERHGAGAHSSRKVRCARAGEGGVSIA
jgi:integrase